MVQLPAVSAPDGRHRRSPVTSRSLTDASFASRSARGVTSTRSAIPYQLAPDLTSSVDPPDEQLKPAAETTGVPPIGPTDNPTMAIPLVMTTAAVRRNSAPTSIAYRFLFSPGPERIVRVIARIVSPEPGPGDELPHG